MKKLLIVTAILALAFPFATVSPAAAVKAKDTTRVTLLVSGCEGCLLHPESIMQDSNGKMLWQWGGTAVRVHKGKAVIKVPTDKTKGLSLEITTPWQKGDIGAQPLVALSKGRPATFDKNFMEYNWCWGGTTARTATIHIQVKRMKGESQYGGIAVWPLAWNTATPKPNTAPGHQDLPYCQAI